MRARSALLSGLVVLLTGSATAFAAAAGVSGNKSAIAIARAEAHAYGRVAAQTYTQTGYIEINDQEGKTSYFNFDWGQPKLAPGWVWATEHAVVSLKHDRVVWWRDDLTPPPCTGAGFCHQIPVEIVSDKAGAYYAFGNAATHTCFGKLRGNQPVTVGAVWNRVLGHFSAPVYGPGVIKLTYTFPWGHGVARETDTLAAASDLAKSGKTVIPGGHTIRYSTRERTSSPKAPKVNLCAG